MDPGFSSNEYIPNLLWVNYGQDRTGWTLDLPLPGYSLSGFIELSTTALRLLLKRKSVLLT